MLFMFRLSDVRVVLRRRDRERSTPPFGPMSLQYRSRLFSVMFTWGRVISC